jgi:hypothetical protein
MAIAADPKLANVAHGPLLPPHWRTLYELTKLDDATFEEKIADGTIRPDMERRDIEQSREATRRFGFARAGGQLARNSRLPTTVRGAAWCRGPPVSAADRKYHQRLIVFSAVPRRAARLP